jgi:hypothetical protein
MHNRLIKLVKLAAPDTALAITIASPGKTFDNNFSYQI